MYVIIWLIILSLILITGFFIVLKIVQVFTLGRCNCPNFLLGKTAIITGGSAGIGYYTALGLASRGCRIIIGCRSNSEDLKQKINKETNNYNILVKYLDLASLDSIRRFAQEVTATEERLDILINNAGVGSAGTRRTIDGLDPTMQTNYLGHFLLTHLLLGLLRRSAPSRIIFVSSAITLLQFMTWGSFDVPENRDIGFFNGLRVYIHSKLCQIASAREFARRLKDSGISCNSLHTGVVKTDLYDKSSDAAKASSFVMKFLKILVAFYGKTPEEGAQTSLHLAMAKELENVSGKYFWDCHPFFTPSKAKNQSFVRKMWQESEKLVQLKEDEKLTLK